VRVRPAREQYPLYGRSVALLRTVRPEEAQRPISSTQIEALRREVRRPTRSSTTAPPLRNERLL